MKVKDMVVCGVRSPTNYRGCANLVSAAGELCWRHNPSRPRRAALARQARIDARTLELIEEASAVDSGNTVGVHVRAALTEARRIATEEADADTTKED